MKKMLSAYFFFTQFGEGYEDENTYRAGNCQKKKKKKKKKKKNVFSKWKEFSYLESKCFPFRLDLGWL